MTFDTAFPWIGLIFAAVLLVLLPSDALRADRRVSRLRDVRWLSWAGVAAYLLHNVEEYGIDLHGERYAFPKAFCGMFGHAALYPHCPAPGAVFTAVNVPMFWLAAPLAAWLSGRHRLTGLALYGVIAVNLAAHLGRAAATGWQYNPGRLTALLLFLPLAAWTLLGAKLLSWRAVLGLIGLGLGLHLVLIAAMLLLLKGVLHAPGLVVALEALNAGAMLVVTLWAERRAPHRA